MRKSALFSRPLIKQQRDNKCVLTLLLPSLFLTTKPRTKDSTIMLASTSGAFGRLFLRWSLFLSGWSTDPSVRRRVSFLHVIVSKRRFKRPQSLAEMTAQRDKVIVLSSSLFARDRKRARRDDGKRVVETQR